jgi:hypothetical protein
MISRLLSSAYIDEKELTKNGESPNEVLVAVVLNEV